MFGMIRSNNVLTGPVLGTQIKRRRTSLEGKLNDDDGNAGSAGLGMSHDPKQRSGILSAVTFICLWSPGAYLETRSLVVVVVIRLPN